MSLEIKPNKSRNAANIFYYLEKKTLGAGWGMTAKVNSDAVVSDRVCTDMFGEMSDFSVDLSKSTKFVKLQWYISSGHPR